MAPECEIYPVRNPWSSQGFIIDLNNEKRITDLLYRQASSGIHFWFLCQYGKQELKARVVWSLSNYFILMNLEITKLYCKYIFVPEILMAMRKIQRSANHLKIKILIRTNVHSIKKSSNLKCSVVEFTEEIFF